MDTVDNRFHRRSGRVFCPPRLWVTAVDNQGPLWTGGSCAHPIHRPARVLPSAVPRNTPVLPRPTHLLGVTAFTPGWDRPRFVAEQWTKMWRSGLPLCTTALSLWASGGQPRTDAGRCPIRPQSVDSGCPHIHTPLSWAGSSDGGQPVEGIGTTPVSPGCGKTNRRDPVEKRIAATSNRTEEAGRGGPGADGEPPGARDPGRLSGGRGGGVPPGISS